MGLDYPTLIALLGPPLMGKTTLGAKIAEQLDVRYVDHEVHCRVPFFGLGHPDPDASPQERSEFNIKQATAYDVLFAVAGAYLDLGRSLVVSATFVSERSQTALGGLVESRPRTALCCVWCYTENDPDDVVKERLAGRVFGAGGYVGGVNDLESYRVQKARWKRPPAMPHLELDTFPPYTVEECVLSVLKYVHRS